MVEAEFGFLEVEVKRLLGYAIKFGEPALSVAPEAFDAVDMPLPISEFICAVIDSKMLVETNVHQAVITSPPIGVDDRTQINMAADNRLQGGLGAVGHDLGVDLAVTLEKTEYDGLAVGAATAFATDTASTEVGLINLDGAIERRFLLTSLGDPLTYLEKNRINRAQGNTRQCGGIGGRKIHGKKTDQLPKFSLADSRTPVVSIFNNHLRKLAYLNMCLTS